MSDLAKWDRPANHTVPGCTDITPLRAWADHKLGGGMPWNDVCTACGCASIDLYRETRKGYTAPLLRSLDRHRREIAEMEAQVDELTKRLEAAPCKSST